MHGSAILEEGEKHDAEEQIFEDEANPSLMVTPGAVYTDVPKDCELQQNTSPNGIKSSPSYAKLLRRNRWIAQALQMKTLLSKPPKKVGNLENMLEKKRQRG